MPRLVFFLIAGFVFSSALAQSAGFDKNAMQRAEQLRDQSLQKNQAYALVSSLTTEVGPRMAGTPGDAASVAWAQAKFKALGYDRVWLQPVTFPVWQRGHEVASVVSPAPQPLVITTLGGSVGTDGKVIEAEIVEFSNLAALKAAPEKNLEGKIAFISNKMTRAKDGSGYGPAVGARSSGASEAAKKGAIAILIRSIGTSSHRFPHTGNMRYAADVKKIPAAALSAPDAEQLSRLLALKQPVRVKLDIAAGYTGTYTSYNVIGEIRGREKPQEYVVIGGHLDSWDLGTGAVDDGAGVAITMAAGAKIAAMKHRPRRTIRVIAFANEEQGLFGAKAYADSQAEKIANHQIGAESDFGAGRIYALRASLDDAAWPVIEQIGAVLKPLNIETQKGVGGPGPDIGPTSAKGMPWAQLAQDGTDYFDYHHTPNDTLDKIDPAALDQQVAAYAVFAYLSAETVQDFGSRKPVDAP